MNVAWPATRSDSERAIDRDRKAWPEKSGREGERAKGEEVKKQK